jgi:hypothetical protein
MQECVSVCVCVCVCVCVRERERERERDCQELQILELPDVKYEPTGILITCWCL